jgi:hypothetical protein
MSSSLQLLECVCHNINVTTSRQPLFVSLYIACTSLVNLTGLHRPARARLQWGMCNYELLDQVSAQLRLLGRAGGRKQAAVISG